MILRRLSITGFRNIERVELDLADGVTLFWGRNAQGKTNLLESVHYLATGRSFRTRTDRECLPWESEAGAVARIEGRVQQSEVSHNLALALTERAKSAWVDGKALARLGDLLGKLTVVLFTPDDIAIAAGSPALRRRFLDMALSQVDAVYLHHLQDYTEALRQRNAALRTGDSSLGGGYSEGGPFDPWVGPLVEHGVEVSLIRRETVRRLADLAGEIYGRIAPDDSPLTMEYRSRAAIGADDDRESAQEHFRRRLAEVAETERARGQTLIGPHRDELVLAIGRREVRDYGSQGQQRSAVLALRLAEVRWMAERTGETPLLLVDDLGSELDHDRRDHLFSLLGAGVQTLATTAGDPKALGRQIGADCEIEVSDGALRQ